MTEYDLTQRSALRMLLDAHPRLLDVGDWTTGSPMFPACGTRCDCSLTTSIATMLGDRVGASRAAVRFDALNHPV